MIIAPDVQSDVTFVFAMIERMQDMTMTLEVDLPDDLPRLQLPRAVAARLQTLLDRQDNHLPLSTQGREEAECLVNLAEFLTLLRLREERRAK